MEFTIREERPEDFFAAELVTKRAFWNLHRPGCDEHLLVHKLRKDESYLSELSRVAEKDGRIIGAIYYAKAKLVKESGEEKTIISFGPLCVDPDFQRMGVGGRLLDETLALAKTKGFSGVVIYGEPEYYPRHGFLTCDSFGVTTPDGKNFPAFMGIELVKGGLPSGRFFEPAVYFDLPSEELDEFDKAFPYMEKLVLPGQWQED